MFHVIVSVIAVALAAVILSSGMNYLNVDRLNSVQVSTNLSSEYSSMRLAATSHQIAYGAIPRADHWQSDMAEFLPATSVPRNPDGFTWSYVVDGEGAASRYYLCATHASPTDAHIMGAQNAAETISSWRTVLSQSCGSEPGDPASGEELALTLYPIETL